jgi:Skp family chaperone for outer membrane proteins
VALALMGCKGSQSASASTGGDGASSAPSSDSGTRTENIVDPTMDNQTAFYVTIPAKWKFRGTLLQGGEDSCDSGFNGVYRATSEDGRSFSEALPQLLWAYGNGPRPAAGCLPLDKPIGAQEFLRYLSTTMRLDYIGDAPMPDALANAVRQWRDGFARNAAPSNAANNQQQPHNTADGAAAMVRYNRNGVSMEGRLTVLLYCTELSFPGLQLAGMASKPATISGKCVASTAYVTAPESQFPAVVRLWDDPAMVMKQNKIWGDARMKRFADQRAAAGQQFQHNVQEHNKAWLDDSNRNFQAQQAAFGQSAEVRHQMNNEFMDAMQQRTNGSIQRTADAMQARSTATSDWVDYALDRQTVLDVNTGQTGKISNQVTPGGALQKVHGDGTP